MINHLNVFDIWLNGCLFKFFKTDSHWFVCVVYSKCTPTNSCSWCKIDSCHMCYNHVIQVFHLFTQNHSYRMIWTVYTSTELVLNDFNQCGPYVTSINLNVYLFYLISAVYNIGDIDFYIICSHNFIIFWGRYNIVQYLWKDLILVICVIRTFECVINVIRCMKFSCSLLPRFCQ